MPEYTPQTKRTARATKRSAELTASVCGALGIESNPRYLYLAFFFGMIGQVAGDVAEDPPRRDFRVATRVRPSLATPEYIDTPTPADRVLVETAKAADSAERRLAAHLRAFERVQGAHRAGQEAEAQQRAGEAIFLAHASGRALRDLSERTGALNQIVRPGEQAPSREGRPRVTDLDSESLAVVFLGGLRIRDIEKVLHGTRMEDTAVANKRFGEASAAFAELATEMSDWAPPPESELSL